MASKSPVAIVTGAARPWGMGRAAAMGLAEKGMDIVVADIRDEWGEEAANTIKGETGQNALYIRTDVSQRSSVQSMVARTVKEFGRIDVLANIAGIVMQLRLEDATEENFDRIININLRGTLLTCQAVIPTMRKQKSGHIVNTASGGAVKPHIGLGLYSATKAGVVMISKTLAWELAADGIVVTTVAPGPMATAMGSDEAPTEEYVQSMNSGAIPYPWGRPLYGKEVADVVVFAATVPSHALTGQTLHANGGGSYMV